MASLQILHFPDPRLRKIAVDVTSVDGEINSLAKNMLEAMYDDGGIGLAATQVNIQKRVIVMDLSEDKNKPAFLINPVILQTEGNVKTQEGCLSVPGFYDYVERAEWVKCRYVDLDGEVKEIETEGLLAVCIQHEIDHLDGKLFIDYLSSLKLKRLMKKLEKQEKQEKQQAITL